jgi:hypothetical protein
VRTSEPEGRGSRSLEEEVDHFDRFASGLVRLEPYSLEELRRTVGEFTTLVERHLDRAERTSRPAIAMGRTELSRPGLLEGEHQRFRTSLAELRGLLGVVEREDHGGHRQALGQYGRILAEALRAHFRDEAPGGPSRRQPVAPSKHN